MFFISAAFTESIATFFGAPLVGTAATYTAIAGGVALGIGEIAAEKKEKGVDPNGFLTLLD